MGAATQLNLTDEQRRVLELRHKWPVRAGAKLGRKDKVRVAEINQRLATLATQFSQNVLKDEQSWRMVLDGERDLAGLSDNLRASAARAAADMDPNGGLKGKHVITLARSSIEPFLQFSARRDLREEAFNAWVKRGEMSGATDNASSPRRSSRCAASLPACWASRATPSTASTTPWPRRRRACATCSPVWTPAAKRACRRARRRCSSRAHAEGGNFEIAPWDWRYYAEKERKALYDVDEAATRPYLTLENVVAAAFETASRLFGLRFKELPDAPRYHDDVRVWEVTDKRGAHVGLFLGDYFARPSKRSGAWMSSFRSQSKVRASTPHHRQRDELCPRRAGKPTLLSLDDARTLFHEFGHGLHGLLSDVTYPSISGTAVTRDFVELPSQLYEHWLMVPEVLQRFAVHYRTGKPMPPKLAQRIKKARNFNQGFSTVEYVASALVDMELHALPEVEGLDVDAFERATLKRLGMPRAIVMRHRIRISCTSWAAVRLAV
jgi:peptidyl-dipeptidase Dcp